MNLNYDVSCFATNSVFVQLNYSTIIFIESTARRVISCAIKLARPIHNQPLALKHDHDKTYQTNA